MVRQTRATTDARRTRRTFKPEAFCEEEYRPTFDYE